MTDMPSSQLAGVFSPPVVTGAALNGTREDARAISRLFRKHTCDHLFLDVGANLGLQLRKLYEPELFHGASVERMFTQLFGPPPRCHVCAISIEPNPLHAEHLTVMHRHLRTLGVGALFLEAAASDADGDVEFFVGRNAASDADMGASASPLKARQQRERYGRNVRAHRVRTVDLAHLIGLAQSHLRPGGKVLMKLDVETLELRILPQLVWTRSLCTGVDAVLVEWHDHIIADAADDGKAPAGGVPLRRMAKSMRAALTAAFDGSPSRDCRTALVTMDDESYVTFDVKSIAPMGTAACAPRADTPLPRLGYCDFTESGKEGECDGPVGAALKGSWPLSPTLRTLADCAARCAASCARCNYVSFSAELGDCSWFHLCDLSKLRSQHGASFRTLPVPKAARPLDPVHAPIQRVHAPVERVHAPVRSISRPPNPPRTPPLIHASTLWTDETRERVYAWAQKPELRGAFARRRAVLAAAASSANITALMHRLWARGMRATELGLDFTRVVRTRDPLNPDADVASALRLLLLAPNPTQFWAATTLMWAVDQPARASGKGSASTAPTSADGNGVTASPSVLSSMTAIMANAIAGPAASAGAAARRSGLGTEALRSLRRHGCLSVPTWGLDLSSLRTEAEKALETRGHKFSSGAFHRAEVPSLPSIEPLLKDAAVARIVQSYLGGGAVRYDGLTILRLASRPLMATEYISGLWHHDRCGRRLKLFIFLNDVDESSRPTEVAVGSHNTMYYSYALDDSRHNDAWVRTRYDVRPMTGVAGGGFLFDTNMLHRANLDGHEGRTVVLLEFHAHGKIPPIDALYSSGLLDRKISLPCPSAVHGDENFRAFEPLFMPEAPMPPEAYPPPPTEPPLPAALLPKANARSGMCPGADVMDVGDCASGVVGSLGLRSHALKTLDDCMLACSLCARCAFVSFSNAHDECAWHARCDALQPPPTTGPDYVVAELPSGARARRMLPQLLMMRTKLPRRIPKQVWSRGAEWGSFFAQQATPDSLAQADPAGECAAVLAAAMTALHAVPVMTRAAALNATWRVCALAGQQLESVFPRGVRFWQ